MTSYPHTSKPRWRTEPLGTTTARRLLPTAVGPALLASAATAAGAEARFKATVSRTLAADETIYGGCMAVLAVAPHPEGLDCRKQPWVTFDCAGTYIGKASALRMYDVAQVAQLTERQVEVIVDDSRKHGGFCLVRRIDLLAEVGDND